MLLKLIFRNAFRRKLRTALTVGGMCVAILAFGLLRTVVNAWYAGVEASSANRLITRNAISLGFFLPFSYRDKIRAVEEVVAVSYGNWFGGIYIDQKNFFANFAVDAKTYLELYPEFALPNDQSEAFLKDRRGCIAGRKLAARFGWKIGDSITLSGTIYPGNWDLVLRGIYHGRDKNTDATQFFFHWDYLNETLKKTVPRRADQIGFFIVAVANPDLAAQAAEAVDKVFKNSFAETLTETERSFQLGFVSMTKAILTVIQLVSLIIIIIILVVVANTMAMSVRERAAEYAVFKTLGFGAFHLTVLILGESLCIAALGAVSGILLTYPAASAFVSAVGSFFPVFDITRQTIYLDIAAAMVVGVVAAVVPAWQAVSVPIAKGLGRVG